MPNNTITSEYAKNFKKAHLIYKIFSSQYLKKSAMTFLQRLALVLIVTLMCSFSGHCVDFYPFGEGVGDAMLSSTDQSVSAGELSPGFPFLGSNITSLFVSIIKIIVIMTRM